LNWGSRSPVATDFFAGRLATMIWRLPLLQASSLARYAAQVKENPEKEDPELQTSRLLACTEHARFDDTPFH